MRLWNGTRKVIVPREEVEEFNDSWPGSNLRNRSYWFEFDENGDLVDTDVPEQDDGSAAAALSQDAQEFMERAWPIEQARREIGHFDLADESARLAARDFLLERGIGEDVADALMEDIESKTIRTSEFDFISEPDEHADLSWLEQQDEDMGEGFEEQAQERLASYGDTWEMIGVVARASLPDTGEEVTSPGLWGIESDIGKDYFLEVFKEEVEELADEIERRGYYVIRDGISRYAAGQMPP